MRRDLDRVLRHTGYGTFFLSGICAISSGVVVSLLGDLYGLSYGMAGILLSAMNIGNMAAAFLAGLLPSKIGQKRTVLLLGAGYGIGYLLGAVTEKTFFLLLSFLLIGLAKGAVLNTDSVLVGTHTEDRRASMQIMHAFYATGALLCPFLFSFFQKAGGTAPMVALSGIGLLLYGIYLLSPVPNETERKKKNASSASSEGTAFLRDPVFWLLTFLIFCQNGAEYGVTGWLVTYYKDRGILSGMLSAYSMTFMWAATLIARLLIAFVLPIRNNFKALTVMGALCTACYAVLVALDTPVPALMALLLFSASMAGVNPMVTASVGQNMNAKSMGIMLPIGSIGGILMPMLIGAVSDAMGLQMGMLTNILPCGGILVLSLLLQRVSRKRN